MRMPKNYENTAAEFKRLPAGGYICEILTCEETRSKSGKPMLKITLDIVDGEYKDYFKTLWRDKRMAAFPAEVKYPPEGTAYIVSEDNEGNCSKSFKQFCTALEDSGNIVWDHGELADLQGAEVGVLFRREETEYNGQCYWNTKPMAYRSVDTIKSGKFKVPDDKPLQSAGPLQYQAPAAPAAGFSTVSEDIPF